MAWTNHPANLGSNVSSAPSYLFHLGQVTYLSVSTFLVYEMRSTMIIVRAPNSCVLVGLNAHIMLLLLNYEFIEYRNHIIVSF